MSKRYTKPLSLEELSKVEDKDIDLSDMPELDDAFWSKAHLVEPDRTQHVTLRVKKSVLEYFKAQGKGYQTRINTVLESYVRSRQSS